MERVRLLVFVLLLIGVLGVPPAAAQESVAVTTPYPGVAVEAGDSVGFDLVVTAPSRERVDLAVDAVPEGWEAVLRGGGFTIDGVFAGPEVEDAPDVTLDVTVPQDAEEGVYDVAVVAEGTSGSDRLVVSLRVAEAVAGAVSLTTDFPSLRGPADTDFSFDLTLQNDTPEELTFALQVAFGRRRFDRIEAVDRLDHHGRADPGGGPRGEGQVLGGDLVLCGGVDAVDAVAVQRVEHAAAEPLRQSDGHIDVRAEAVGAPWVRHHSPLAGGHVARIEVQPHERGPGVPEGPDQGVHLAVGGQRRVEGPPQLHGVEAGLRCPPWALRQGMLGEQDRQVDVEPQRSARRQGHGDLLSTWW